MADEHSHGCPVQVVGAGTPAAKAGLKPGDQITALGGKPVRDAQALEDALGRTKPDQTVKLTVQRAGKSIELSAHLIRRPLEVVRPEARMPHLFGLEQRQFDAIRLEDDAPLSLLATIEQIDDEKIASDDEKAAPELKGLDLRTCNWKVVEADQTHAVFRRTLPERRLEITKTYRLAKVPAIAQSDADAKAYNLEFQIDVRNLDGKAHDVAYRLDGPNGLPREGAWYAIKVGVKSGGLRDVVYQEAHSNLSMITCPELSDTASKPIPAERPFQFLGVDAQYFSAAMIPDEEASAQIDRAVAFRAGNVDPQRKTITNTSFRIIGKPQKLAPAETLSHHYVLFAGPKRPPLLAQYQLDDLVYYGWFGWIAVPMAKTVDFFYLVTRNYGLAIILLTVLVRMCMFPLSRKQALGAQKMQELQPEIKRIQEKYKRDVEGKTKAQQELFRKHNYHPLSGCLPLFIQFPIFIGLYRSLQVDVELRDAALFSHGIRWCSNLAAPDMLFDWSGFMPDWVNSGVGMLGLGPYFNLFPILTILLFVWQQKMFMPPPADEQAAMQQKMMNFMMIFMGIMFYKVAAGLCIYFIASSLWGIAERKFLPKTAAATAGGSPDVSSFRSGGSNGGGNAARRKRRGKN
jgi:YidC/Oxa1 family membrane protein insertase